VIELAAGRVVAEGHSGPLASASAREAARPSLPARLPRLVAEGLNVALGQGSARRMVLHDVSLAVQPGQALAVVGESGSGKTTLARALLRLVDVSHGRVQVEGTDWLSLRGAALRRARPQLQLVQQDPFAALNPRLTVRALLTEPLAVHGLCPAEARPQRVRELLECVQLPQQALDRYPHAFSGGQRQRLCIARALALNPRVLIADEAVSALDPAVQAEILQLFNTLKGGQGLTLVFITHDWAAAAAVCEHALVLHQGRVVEQGPVAELLRSPAHPYTQSLVAAARWANPNL